jgi:hypothetical protein
MKRSYQRYLFAGALLIAALLCLGQAITTKDLLLAGKGQNSAPVESLVGTGAMNQAPLAKSLTPDQEGPQTAGSTIVWTGNAYDPDGDRMLYQFWLMPMIRMEIGCCISSGSTGLSQETAGKR